MESKETITSESEQGSTPNEHTIKDCKYMVSCHFEEPKQSLKDAMQSIAKRRLTKAQ